LTWGDADGKICGITNKFSFDLLNITVKIALAKTVDNSNIAGMLKGQKNP